MGHKILNNYKKTTLLDAFNGILWLNTCSSNMSKQKKAKQAKNIADNSQGIASNEPISLDSAGNLTIQVLAKPGAKQNAITDISSEGVGIQINAPPSDGEANAELVKYISSVIGVRKGDISIEKGFKSRRKTVKVLAGNVTLQQLEDKLKSEMF